MNNLKKVWIIALKDLKLFFKDAGTIFFFIAFPFMFIVLFNFLLSGAYGGDERLELHLATREAPGGLSYQILAAMETTDVSQLEAGAPAFVWDRDYEAARQAVENEELAGFIAFPADFTTSLANGTPTSLEVFTQAGDINTRAALDGVARAIASQIGTHQVIIRSAVALLVKNGDLHPNDIQQAVQKIMADLFAGGVAGDGNNYITFQIENVGVVEAENPSNFVFPGYLVMFVFFAAAITAEAIVRERQNNTLERLMSTSVSKEVILGGIFTGIALRGLVQIIIFWVVGILAFNIDLGLSPVAVFLLSFLMVIMSSAFAVMLATLAKTRRSAGALANITALVLAPLGGCWWPFFLYPDWIQTFARITPHAWATTGFNKLMVFGADFAAAVPNMVALLVFTVIFGLIAIWRFRTSAS